MSNIRQIREGLGLSRQKMSEALGVTYQTVYNLENRSYKRGPSPLVQEKISALVQELPKIQRDLRRRVEASEGGPSR